MRRPSRQQGKINPLCRKTGPRGKRHKGVTGASQNIETSKKGYAAFDEGDVEAVLNDYDDERRVCHTR